MTVNQLRLRLSQITHWPSSARRLRELRKQNLAPVSTLAADYITLWGGVWLIANDLVLGNAVGNLLLQVTPELSERLKGFLQLHLDQSVDEVLRWLTTWPLGLKLNTELSLFFGDLYSGLNAFFHDAGTRHLLQHLRAILQLHAYATRFGGLTMGISLLCDLLTLCTLHLTLFHYIARWLYTSFLYLLGALFHLFRGKKRNPLRRGRIDAATYEPDQMLLGTILFTLLAFLFPTVFTYHLTFAAARLGLVVLQAALSTSAALLNHVPLFALMLRLKDPARLPGGVSLQLIGSPRLPSAQRREPIRSPIAQGARPVRTPDGHGNCQSDPLSHYQEATQARDARITAVVTGGEIGVSAAPSRRSHHHVRAAPGDGDSSIAITHYELRGMPLGLAALFDGYARHLTDVRRLPVLLGRIFTGEPVRL